ncbi:MAG: hypothetical protein SGJ20_08100 [Planctomycetota bacterium]|nr:hypothetical protein [Planctomycetota bacterium]
MLQLLLYLLRKGLAPEVPEQAPKDNAAYAERNQGTTATSDPVAGGLPPADIPPCSVGIVVALPIETGSLLDRLTGTVTVRGHGFKIHTGSLHGQGIAIVLAGAGRRAAQYATEALIAGHHPRWVFSAGFAGGLHSELKRGDILLPDKLIDASGRQLSVDLKIDQSGIGKDVHVGSLLTVDRVVTQPSEKLSLGQQHHALAVDMETYAVAQVCQQEKQPFIAIRVISDSVEDTLPRDIERLLRKPRLAQDVGAAAGGAIRRRASIKDLGKVLEQAVVSAERLAHFLEGMIKQLPK